MKKITCWTFILFLALSGCAETSEPTDDKTDSIAPVQGDLGYAEESHFTNLRQLTFG